MTIVNTETGELSEALSEDAARRLTERIRIAATNYTDAKAKVLRLVDEARAGSAHVALGYKSWTAYLSDVLSDEPLRLARDDRRELVEHLADRGMSTRAIAPIVGVDHTTVGADLRSTGGFPPVDQDRTASRTVVRQTEGLDGRTRTSVVAGQVKRPPADNPSRETTLINDIRLYLQTMSTSKEIRALTPEGRLHIITALTNAATHIQEL